MNKKAQIGGGPIISVIFLLIILSAILPALTSTINAVSCNQEKNQILDLQNKLNQCQNLLIGEQQKTQNAINTLEECKKQLIECRNQSQNCIDQYNKLQEECSKKDQPTITYYFIKIFNDKIILFDIIVIYNIQLFSLFFAFGVTFTIKLFEINLEIKVLNKASQRKLIKILRIFLIENPYAPVIVVALIILLTNLLLYIFS